MFLIRQRRQRLGRVLVELHEHEVPELEEALVLAAGQVVRLAALDAEVEVELGVGAARTGRPGLPEVLLAGAFDDPLTRHADLEPEVDRLLVRADPELIVAAEDGHPDVVLVETEAVARELPGEPNRLALEVVAEAEVAEHLEHRQVACGHADVLNVDRAEGRLAGRQPLARRLLGPGEVRLQRVHAGDDEQRRGVGRRRDQRGAALRQVAVLLEERPERAADLVRRHRHGAGVYAGLMLRAGAR